MFLFAEFDWWYLFQTLWDGLSFGSLIALIALGYTMVFGIIGLINFAHGDVFMLGSFLCLTILKWTYPEGELPEGTGIVKIVAMILLLIVTTSIFCSLINVTIDRLVYKPLRRAPKLAPLVSAIGVSFILVNIGQYWGGPLDVNVKPQLVSSDNLLKPTIIVNEAGEKEEIQPKFTIREHDILIMAVVIPLMILLTWLVKRTKLGKAMRAVQQNQTAAELMGIPVERVIAATFAIGGALAGAASVIDSLTRGTNNFQFGYKFGLYAFTAAVLGGIGSIPGAVLGGIVIGLIRQLTEGYLDAQWSNSMIFGILVIILIFRPSGLLGRTAKEKV